jgi:uncharacterized membrane protein
MAEETSFADVVVTTDEIGIRRIHVHDLWQSLREGYDDFNAKPSLGVFVTIIYPLVALLLTLYLLGEHPLHMIFPVIAGFTLLGPVVSVALFEMSRRRERGLDLTWRSAFQFIHSSSFAPILALSIGMMLLYVGWLFMAKFLYVGLFGAHPPVSIADFATQLVTTRRGGALVFYGNAVGFVFAFTALAISVVGFPLLLDKPVSSVTAMITSIRAVTSNPAVMAVWGVTVVVLLAAGALLLLVGLAAVLPILGHATWHRRPASLARAHVARRSERATLRGSSRRSPAENRSTSPASAAPTTPSRRARSQLLDSRT